MTEDGKIELIHRLYSTLPSAKRSQLKRSLGEQRQSIEFSSPQLTIIGI
jgi:hypothetical protein